MAVEVVQGLKRLPARTRKALVKHIGKTPYAIFNQVTHITITDGKPKFAYYRAARCDPPAWGQFLDDLRQECLAGLPPVPYRSKNLRDKQAKRVSSEFGELQISQHEKAALLDHIARSPYLAV